MAAVAYSSQLCCDNDEDSLPECFLPSEPVQDVYDSDNSLETQKQVDKNRCKKCEIWTSTPKKLKDNLCSSVIKADNLQLQGEKNERKKKPIHSDESFERSITKSTRAVYLTHQPHLHFTKVENPTLAQCLEELLDFALEENHERRAVVDGKKLVDGKTIHEIIHYWIQRNGKLKWLIQHFTQDIDMGNSQVQDLMTEVTGSEETAEECGEFDDVKETCLDFIHHFLEILQTAEKYDTQDIEGSSSDELQDTFKHVVSLIAGFLDVPYRSNGECRHKFSISEVRQDSQGVSYEEHDITATPDYIIKTRDGGINMPVQVYAPILPVNERCLNFSQITNAKTKFQTDHLTQHVGLLCYKLADLMDRFGVGVTDKQSTSPVLDKTHVSVGMFLTREAVHFSKVQTSLRHMQSFIKCFLPHSVQTQLQTRTGPAVIGRHMLNNVQDNGLVVTKSRWHVDLTKAVHRNALFIFLLQYVRRCSVKTYM